MSINLQKRMTTGLKTAFVSCTQLPVREDIISKQAMVSYNGGNGRGGKPKSNTLGDVVNLPTNKPSDGGAERRRQQLEGAMLLQRLREIQRDTARVNARQRQIDNFFDSINIPARIDETIDEISQGIEDVGNNLDQYLYHAYGGG